MYCCEEETFSQKTSRIERLCMWPFANSELVDVTCLITEYTCTHCICEKSKRSNYHCNYQLITEGKLWLTGNYNLPLIISLDFPIHRRSYFALFMSTKVCSSACRRYEPLIVALTLSYILLFLVITCTSLYTLVAIYIY